MAFAVLLAVSSAALAESRRHGGERKHHEGEEKGLYVRRNLVSDGCLSAEHVDPNLVNSWGIAAGPATPWWVADNGTGVATLYDGEGNPQPPNNPLVVTVTGGGYPPSQSAPTGIVFNGGPNFVISMGDASGPAIFIFASEDGTISGWNPNVPPPPPAKQTVVVVDKGEAAVYKGLAIARTKEGDRLYATNFRAGAVEVYDGKFMPVASAGFADPALPPGYAPFGIRVLGGRVFVTYALQDETKTDDVPGKHHGFIDAFSLKGDLLQRVVSGGKLDSPWGLALAPQTFGPFSRHLLVGNFGDGHLIAYDLERDERRDERKSDEQRGEFLEDVRGPIIIDGLWGIDFGNGDGSGPVNALYFASGPDDENHGLFGRIDPAQEAKSP